MRKREPAGGQERQRPPLSVVTGGEPAPAKPAPGFSDHLGPLLREMYQATLNEPVPERFLALLREMDAKSEQKPGAAEPD